MPSPATISHNLRELLRIHILKAFKNFKDLNQIRSQKPGLQGSETQYRYYKSTPPTSAIFVAILCAFSSLAISLL